MYRRVGDPDKRCDTREIRFVVRSRTSVRSKKDLSRRLSNANLRSAQRVAQQRAGRFWSRLGIPCHRAAVHRMSNEIDHKQQWPKTIWRRRFARSLARSAQRGPVCSPLASTVDCLPPYLAMGFLSRRTRSHNTTASPRLPRKKLIVRAGIRVRAGKYTSPVHEEM